MKIEEHNFPSDWKLDSIAKSFDFTRKPRGLDLAKNGSEIPFFPMDRIPLGRIQVSDFTSKPVDKLGSGTYVENGDLMVAKITPSFENGKQAVVDINTDFAFATTEVIPMRGREAESDTLFLFFYLLHPGVRADLAGKMEGSTGRQRLGKTVLGDRFIPLPPLAEQKRIAYILSIVQRAIEAQERIIQTTTELKKALMHKLFTEGLRSGPQKQTEIGPVPESWEVVSLGSLIEITHGFAFKSKFFTTEGPTVLTPGNFKLDGGLYWGKRTKYTTEDYPDHIVFSPGDLVVVMTDLTPTAKLLGGPAFIPDGRIILHNQRIGKVTLTDDRTSPDFLYRVFLSDSFKCYMRQTATGSTVRHTSPSKIKEFRFGLPTEQEQAEVIYMLGCVDAKIADAEQKKTTLQALFRTLLHELMTAKTRVHKLEFSS